MSKKDRFNDLLGNTEPTGAAQKERLIVGFTESQEDRNTGLQATALAIESHKKKATFDMDKDLHTKFKMHAASKGVPMVDILEQLIRGYLSESN